MEMMEIYKYIFIMKKKKFGAENVGWATAQLYCKGWRYCIVGLDCIAVDLERVVL